MERDEKLHEKIDIVVERIHNIDMTLVRQEETLKEHIRRSLANEQAVDILKEELKPLKKRENFISSVLKFIIACSSVLAFLASVGWLNRILKLFL